MKKITPLLIFLYVFCFSLLAYSSNESLSAKDGKKSLCFPDVEDAEEQYNLGRHYEYGYGGSPDAMKAAICYKEAALQGHMKAQHALGLLHKTKILADPQESARWFRAAAEQGYALSYYYLGEAYEGGIGVPRNDSEAAKWYKRAAIQGDSMAMYALARLYFSGRGVPKDIIKAYAWNNVSAALGFDMAKNLELCEEYNLKRQPVTLPFYI